MYIIQYEYNGVREYIRDAKRLTFTLKRGTAQIFEVESLAALTVEALKMKFPELPFEVVEK